MCESNARAPAVFSVACLTLGTHCGLDELIDWYVVTPGSDFALVCRYVVDSADPEALEQSRHELHELLSKPSLAGIPVLVLGNKNDLPGALKEMELIEQM